MQKNCVKKPDGTWKCLTGDPVPLELLTNTKPIFSIPEGDKARLSSDKPAEPAPDRPMNTYITPEPGRIIGYIRKVPKDEDWGSLDLSSSKRE
jgi:hypothetical protein